MDLNGVPLASADGQPRIFVADDACLSRLRLSQVLRGAGYEVVLKPDDVALSDAVESEGLPPDLLVVPVRPGDPASLEAIRDLRARGLTKGAAILGVTPIGGGNLDLDSLRREGICGVVDRSSIPEDVVARVNRMLRAPNERRRHLRASTQLPIELAAEGATSRELATSLSIGGMGVCAERRIAVNTRLCVRFSLPEAPEERIDAEGRVTYVREIGASTRSFGMFFDRLPDRAVALIHREVERLLSAE
jgi:DNA-binding response OmpR family regulator